MEEVKKLAAMGFARDIMSMQGLDYKELLAHLEGRGNLEEVV